MKPKIIIVSGPTASGKTALALELAHLFNGSIISADSRQIYKGLNIGTGKDLNKSSIFVAQSSHDNFDIGYHLINNIQVWLLDVIKPNQSFSVAQYAKLALSVIYDLHSKNLLPIVVGGSGQYIDAIRNPQPTFSVKPNPFLRFILNRLPLNLLQITLRVIDNQIFNLLNNSDRNNPRRLIRKIEIKLSKNRKVDVQPDLDVLHIHLTAPNTYLYKKINDRVTARLKDGLLDEIKKILINYNWSDPGLNTLAYKEFKLFFENKASLESCVVRWQNDEHAYLRRQKTWFKKSPNINQFDITKDDFRYRIINLIKSFLISN